MRGWRLIAEPRLDILALDDVTCGAQGLHGAQCLTECARVAGGLHKLVLPHPASVTVSRTIHEWKRECTTVYQPARATLPLMPTESDFNQHISERTDKALRHAARRALVRDTNRDYWLKLKGDKATAAQLLIETTTAHEPETAQEWIDLPLPLLKAAAVADSGLNVRGVALLRDECWDRAKVMEPGRFGAKAQVVADVRVQHQVIDSSALTPDQRQAMRELLQAAIVQSALPAPERGNEDDT